jgi:hypothetical protein
MVTIVCATIVQYHRLLHATDFDVRLPEGKEKVFDAGVAGSQSDRLLRQQRLMEPMHVSSWFSWSLAIDNITAARKP